MSLTASFRDAPIKRKLMLIGLLTSGLALVAISLILTSRDIVEWRTRTVSELTTYASMIGMNVAPAMLFDDTKAATETLSALSANPDITRAIVLDKENKVFAVYNASRHSAAPMVRPELGQYRFNYDSLVISQPVRLRNDALGSIFLESDLDSLYVGVLRGTSLIFLAALLVFVVAASFFARLQKAIAGPILDLASVMQEVSAQQDYAARAQIHGRDEVGVLAGTFNDMLERMQERDAELALHRQHLEDEVAQRTADLKESNTRLGRELVERKRAEESIHKLNEELEAKVEERTKQLMDAQQTLVRNEKLAVLGQVAGSVGHELRNPLGVMNNAVYFLQTVLSDADENVKEYLGIIKDEIAGSERIVSDLLDSVRTKPPHPETVGIREVISQALRKCVVPPRVILEINLPDELPPIKIDPMQMHQVFRNLLSNSIDAMPEGGRLVVMGACEEGGKMVTVSICDTGTGIAPENLPKLFQPLFTTKARGIGLGLVVVKNLTEANAGQIEVHSVLGTGTTFSVILPSGL